METNMDDFYTDKLFTGIISGIGLIDSWGNATLFEWMESANDWKKLLQKIRFINPENNFDYTKYGDFFFIDNDLFILTDRKGYKTYNIKNNFKNSDFDYLLSKRRYLIKGVFAGFDTLRRDDLNERIYYGDILKVELNNFIKCKTCEYFGGPFKERDTKDIDVVYGPISFNKGWHHCSNPNESYYIADQAFGIIPNLCMSIKSEIVANVYYDITIENNEKFSLDIIHKASLPDHNPYSCKFWNDFVPTQIRIENSTNRIWEYAINQYKKRIKTQ